MLIRKIMFAMLMFLSAASFAFGDDKNIAATVNGTPIYEVEVQQEVLAVLPTSMGFHGKMSPEKTAELRKEALQRLVDLELKYQDAAAKKIALPKEEREQAIQKAEKRFKNEADLEKAIKSAGFTREQYEKFIERPLVAKLLTKMEVDDKIKVTDDMVKNYYDTNKKRYNKPKQYRASHILCKIDPSLNSEDKKKVRIRAEAILKKIKDGADFGDVASKESDDMTFIKGGDLGYFHAGQTLEELEKQLDLLKVGEMSGIIESLYGLHIVKLTDMRPARQLNFDEIKEKIKKELIESEKKHYFEQWFSGVTKKANISYPAVK